MAKSARPHGAGMSPVETVERLALSVAKEQGLELVEVTLQKESRGKCLCVYVDKDGGLSLDDCERYHKRLQPMLEAVDYDVMEVSSPGLDRPIKTQRDFERSRGAVVEVRLFAAQDGSKTFRGQLAAMDADTVTIAQADGQPRSFQRRAVALIKPVIELEDEDLEGVAFDAADDEE